MKVHVPVSSYLNLFIVYDMRGVYNYIFSFPFYTQFCPLL